MNRDELLSSVISIVPFPIEEEKPGLYPGIFRINPCEDGIPNILHVGESIYHVEVDVGRSIPVTVPSHKIAQSIIDDFVTAQLAVKSGEIDTCGPGIFWKFGKLSVADVREKCQADLDKAVEKQQTWFTRLVQMADDDWEKTRQHRTITDMQRKAAKFLGLERPWLIVLPSFSDATASTTCPSCSTSIKVGIVVCPNCRCILDMARYKTLSFVGDTDG